MGGTPVTRLLGSFSLAALLLLSSCGMGGGGGGGGSSLPSTPFTPPASSNVSVATTTKANDIAVDPSNNVWVVVTHGVMEIPKDATSCATSTECPIVTLGFTPAGIAADGSGNIWVTNNTSGSVTEITTTAISNKSCSSSSCPIFSNYFSSPVGIAADGSGSIWVTDDTSSGKVTDIKLPATSNCSSCTTFSGSFSSPVGIVADGSGNIWVTNDTSPGSVTEIKVGASSCSSSADCPTYGGFSNPVAVAVVTSGGVPWVANSSQGSVYPPGVVAMTSSSPCTTSGGCPEITGFTQPVGLAFDSSLNLWVIDAGTSKAVEITASAISAESCQNDPCYAYSLPAGPLGIATDKLGNIWITLQNGEIVKYTP